MLAVTYSKQPGQRFLGSVHSMGDAREMDAFWLAQVAAWCSSKLHVKLGSPWGKGSAWEHKTAQTAATRQKARNTRATWNVCLFAAQIVGRLT